MFNIYPLRKHRYCLIGILFFTTTFLQVKAQPKTDSTIGVRDHFLDNLVGKWTVQSTANGSSSSAVIEASWVMAHQHLCVHFISNQVIPWLKVPMEFEYFIGCRHTPQKYIVHSISVFGTEDYEGFCYAYRHGNDLDLMQKQPEQPDAVVVQRFTWIPETHSWLIQSWTEVAGKKEEVFWKMNLQAAN